jgi:hypothetical protein
MNKFSNILKLPPFFDYYQEFMNRIALKMKTLDPNLDVPMFNVERKPEEIKLADIPKTFSISAINAADFEIKRFDEVAANDTKFILEVNIIEIFPKPIYNFVNILCQNCQNR